MCLAATILDSADLDYFLQKGPFDALGTYIFQWNTHEMVPGWPAMEWQC